VLVLALTLGDVGSSSSLVATLSIFMVQMKYSREFEIEADDYAATFLPARGIPTTALAQIPTRLAADHHEDRNARDFLSGHPNTSKRIAHRLGSDT
jgi:predicted Zn-dependent protease